MRSEERGFALVAVLLVLALLGIIGAEFAYSMRLEASAMRAWRDGIAAGHLAEAGVEQGIREIAADYAFVAVGDGGLLTFYNKEGIPFPRLARTNVSLGSGSFSYRITDEQARVNINVASAERLDKVLQCLDINKSDRDQMADSILDWIDTNEEHRANGAESDDYYLKLPTPYRARNGPIESINELLQIKGITPAVFYGVDGKPGLGDVFTSRGGAQVNVNTAGPLAFCALGVSDAEISNMSQGRVAGPYLVMPGSLGGRGFVLTTQTFRIEAEGLIDGRPRANVTTIVQKQRAAAGSPIVTLESSGIR